MSQTNLVEAIEDHYARGIPVFGPTGFGSDVQKRSDEKDLGIHPREPEFSRIALYSEVGQNLAREILADQYHAGAAYVLVPDWVRPTALGLEPEQLQNSRRLNIIATEIALGVQREAKNNGDTLYVGGDIGPLLDSHAIGSKLADSYLPPAQIETLHYEKAVTYAHKGITPFFETISTAYEATIIIDYVAPRVLQETGLRSIVSFTPYIENEKVLSRDGEKFSSVVSAASKSNAVGVVGVNCIPIEWTNASLETLKSADKPIIVAPNGPGKPIQSDKGDQRWSLEQEAEAGKKLARETGRQLIEFARNGAIVTSACCGTTVNPYGHAMAAAYKEEYSHRGISPQVLQASALVRTPVYAV